MMVVDEAAKLRDEVKNPEVLMLAALTHDFGKAVTTEVMKGKICSHEHETEGLPLAEKFMSRFEIKEDIKKHVLNLVEKVEFYAEIEKYLRGRLERYYEKLKEA